MVDFSDHLLTFNHRLINIPPKLKDIGRHTNKI